MTDSELRALLARLRDATGQERDRLRAEREEQIRRTCGRTGWWSPPEAPQTVTEIAPRARA